MFRVLLGVVVLLSATGSALAEQGFGDVQRLLFVAARDSTAVSVIDVETEAVVGTVDVGLMPSRMGVSAGVAKLVAIDGATPRFVVVDLVTERAELHALGFVPDRLSISPDGLRLAVADSNGGRMAVFDLLRGASVGGADDLSILSDLMFSADGQRVLLAMTHSEGIVVDAATGHVDNHLGGVAAGATLARAPNGRDGFAKAAGGSMVTQFDLGTGRLTGQIDMGNAAAVVPSGSGRYLLAPDPVSGRLVIARTNPLQLAAVVDTAGVIGASYSAWFDSVAFLPARDRHSLVVIDLDRSTGGPDIALPGRPGLGAVTPDGTKLFLPIEDAGQVAVIDTRSRRLAVSVTVSGRPTAAIMAGSYGICH